MAGNKETKKVQKGENEQEHMGLWQVHEKDYGTVHKGERELRLYARRPKHMFYSC